MPSTLWWLSFNNLPLCRPHITVDWIIKGLAILAVTSYGITSQYNIQDSLNGDLWHMCNVLRCTQYFLIPMRIFCLCFLSHNTTQEAVAIGILMYLCSTLLFLSFLHHPEKKHNKSLAIRFCTDPIYWIGSFLRYPAAIAFADQCVELLNVSERGCLCTPGE